MNKTERLIGWIWIFAFLVHSFSARGRLANLETQIAELRASQVTTEKQSDDLGPPVLKRVEAIGGGP